MRVATDNNPVTPGRGNSPDAVEGALAAAIRDATRIGDLLETLREAKLWIPLPAGAAPSPGGTAVTLPTVRYLGSEFIPAYTSAAVLAASADLERSQDQAPPLSGAPPPHVVVRAADLARLMPPEIGIALNAGASESVPVYPPGVAFLAADEAAGGRSRISLGQPPAEPVELLAAIRTGLAGIPQASQASAAWLSVQFSGEGLIISVALDDPADGAVRDQVVAALERAVEAVRPSAGYPMDVTFPGEGEPDYIDCWIAAFAEPFYRRG
jgi:hypothetical protein